jgi:hypothetical protein
MHALEFDPRQCYYHITDQSCGKPQSDCASCQTPPLRYSAEQIRGMGLLEKRLVLAGRYRRPREVRG